MISPERNAVFDSGKSLAAKTKLLVRFDARGDAVCPRMLRALNIRVIALRRSKDVLFCPRTDRLDRRDFELMMIYRAGFAVFRDHQASAQIFRLPFHDLALSWLCRFLPYMKQDPCQQVF